MSPPIAREIVDLYTYLLAWCDGHLEVILRQSGRERERELLPRYTYMEGTDL